MLTLYDIVAISYAVVNIFLLRYDEFMADYRLVIRWSVKWKKRLDKYAKLAKRKTSSYARYILEARLEELEKQARKKKNLA